MPDDTRRVLQVRVKPRSSRSEVEVGASGEVTVSVRAAPERNRANEEALRLLAAHFGVPPSAVRLLRGASSRLKLVEVRGAARP